MSVERCKDCGRDKFDWNEAMSAQFPKLFIEYREFVEGAAERKDVEGADEIKQHASYMAQSQHLHEWFEDFIRWAILREKVDLQTMLRVLASFNCRIQVISIPNDTRSILGKLGDVLGGTSDGEEPIKH